MNQISAEQYRERLRSFGAPIDRFANHHEGIRYMMEEYALGAIITKEEALSRMVVALAAECEMERSTA